MIRWPLKHGVPRRLPLTAFVLGLVFSSVAMGGSDQLTEYGATRQAWLSHHRIDTNPKLLRGCCFLPRQRDGSDRYYAVLYGDGTFAPSGRIFSFEMGFNPPISAAQARRVAKREAPPDARVVAHARKRTCEQILYRSKTLRRALGYSTVLVELSRNGAGGRYTGVVGNLIFTPASSILGC